MLPKLHNENLLPIAPFVQENAGKSAFEAKPNQQLMTLVSAQQLEQAELQKTKRAFEQWQHSQEQIQSQLTQQIVLLNEEIQGLQKQISVEQDLHSSKMLDLQNQIQAVQKNHQKLLEANQEMEIYGVIKETTKLVMTKGGRFIDQFLSKRIITTLENNQLNNAEKIQAIRDGSKIDYNNFDCKIL